MVLKNRFTYLLSTTCEFEFAISCCDNLSQMSKETGVPFHQLWNSYRRNQTCCGGKYKVRRIDISTPDKFDLENYIEFCSIHNLKPNKVENLRKFKRACELYN